MTDIGDGGAGSREFDELCDTVATRPGVAGPIATEVARMEGGVTGTSEATIEVPVGRAMRVPDHSSVPRLDDWDF